MQSRWNSSAGVAFRAAGSDIHLLRSVPLGAKRPTGTDPVAAFAPRGTDPVDAFAPRGTDPVDAFAH